MVQDVTNRLCYLIKTKQLWAATLSAKSDERVRPDYLTSVEAEQMRGCAEEGLS